MSFYVSLFLLSEWLVYLYRFSLVQLGMCMAWRHAEVLGDGCKHCGTELPLLLDMGHFLPLELEEGQLYWNWLEVERETSFISVSSDILVRDFTKPQLRSVNVGEERSTLRRWPLLQALVLFLPVLCGSQMLQGSRHYSTWSDYVVQRPKPNKKIRSLKTLISIEGIMERMTVFKNLCCLPKWGRQWKSRAEWRGLVMEERESHPGPLPCDS